MLVAGLLLCALLLAIYQWLSGVAYVSSIIRQRERALSGKAGGSVVVMLDAVSEVPTSGYHKQVDALVNELSQTARASEKHGAPVPSLMNLAPPISIDILRESTIWLVSAPLVLMQIAHPLVAYGLKQHARAFDGQSLYLRFIDTVIYNHRVLFAPMDEMLKVSRFVYTTHQNVRGQVEQDCGPYLKGHEYAALDPELLLWVYATMIEYSVLSYELFVRRLTDQEKERHYQFVRRIAPVWGLSPAHMPADWRAFMQYYRHMVQSCDIRRPDSSQDGSDKNRCKLPDGSKNENRSQLPAYGLWESLPAEFMMFSVLARHPWRRAHVLTLVPAAVRRALGGEPCLWFTTVLFGAIRAVYRWLPLRLRQLTSFGEWDCRRRGSHARGYLEQLNDAIGKCFLARLRQQPM